MTQQQNTNNCLRIKLKQANEHTIFHKCEEIAQTQAVT